MNVSRLKKFILGYLVPRVDKLSACRVEEPEPVGGVVRVHSVDAHATHPGNEDETLRVEDEHQGLALSHGIEVETGTVFEDLGAFDGTGVGAAVHHREEDLP